MSINFLTSIRFSQSCLNEMARDQKFTALEKLSGHLDSIFFQSSKGVEIKSVDANGVLFYERIKTVDSLASLCLKALLVILVVPVVIALVLKIIVRLYLYLKYSGKMQELEEPVVLPIEVPSPSILTRKEIIEEFLTQPELSQEQRALLIKSTELLCSRGCTSKEEYEERGILVGSIPRRHTPIEFRLTEIPGFSFIHYPGCLHTWDNGSQDIITSSSKTCDVLRQRLDATVNFLLGVPVRNDMTQEEVENLIKQGRQTNALLGIVGIETFSIHQTLFSLGEHVGVLIIKDLV
ncbi:adherence factor [Chlamydia buteonis]|uniref:Adherence factor n=1 Tax=Chlamydia buteonis TaxID=2494525 RepID=A0ABX8L9L1_9CHLA|nr:adherence factor [Chlamydia buteonis]QXE27041.1 adherence factor [Chlamydia buteonis]QXE28020.1 adherence factor [Chlamydia buteonis]